jgi:hypothetical protein
MWSANFDFEIEELMTIIHTEKNAKINMFRRARVVTSSKILNDIIRSKNDLLFKLLPPVDI